MLKIGAQLSLNRKFEIGAFEKNIFEKNIRLKRLYLEFLFVIKSSLYQNGIIERKKVN